MERQPTVSIILPTYNRDDILEDSIQSVLDQSYTDFELIIVDDGSTDETGEVVANYESERIRYYKHEDNQGAAAARNTGIQRAKGDYIAFQDSDDEWLPNKLEKQMNAFGKSPPNVGVVYTGSWRFVDGERRYLPYPGVETKTGDIRHSIRKFNFITLQVTVVRKECFDHVGYFDENTPPISDWEFWIRVSEQYEFELIDEPLVIARVNEDSISKNSAALVRSRERIVNKHRNSFTTSTLANHLFYVGHGSMKLGNVQNGRKNLFRAAVTYPRPIYVGAALLSVFGSRLYKKVYHSYKHNTFSTDRYREMGDIW